MERVKLNADFVRGQLHAGEVLDAGEVALSWAGMPNKNERAATIEVLDALAAAGFLDRDGEKYRCCARRERIPFTSYSDISVTKLNRAAARIDGMEPSHDTGYGGKSLKLENALARPMNAFWRIAIWRSASWRSTRSRELAPQSERVVLALLGASAFSCLLAYTMPLRLFRAFLHPGRHSPKVLHPGLHR